MTATSLTCLCLLFSQFSQLGPVAAEPTTPFGDGLQGPTTPSIQPASPPPAFSGPGVQPAADSGPASGFGSVYGPPAQDPEPARLDAIEATPAESGSVTFQTPPAIRRSAAASVLADALRTPDRESLGGQPMTLSELLTTASTRDLQKRAVQAYWSLSLATAAYHYATAEAAFLSALPDPSTAYEQSRLSAARASARARRTAARLDALRAQQTVAASVALNEDSLPLATDVPFVESYETHFKVLVERGTAPRQLKWIDQTLPVERELIEDRAQAIRASEDLVQQAVSQYQQGRTPLADVLSASDALRSRQREFLASVATYNHNIAEYALTLNLPSVSGNRLVAMLIKTPETDHSVLAKSSTNTEPIRRVSNEEVIQPEPDPATNATPAPAATAPNLPPSFGQFQQ